MRLASFSSRASGVVLSLVAVALATAVPVVPAFAASYADLSIVLTGPSSVASSATTVDYSIAVKNDGPASVSKMSFSASFPATVVSIVPHASNQPSTCKVNAKNVSCTFIGSPTLTVDQHFTVTVNIASIVNQLCTTNSSKPRVASAKVALPGGRIIDPNRSNNVSSYGVVFPCAQPKSADVSLSTPTVTPAIPVVGSTISFNHIVANAGPDPATQIKLSVTVPKGFIFVPSSSLPGCIASKNAVICTNVPLSTFFDITFSVPSTIRCGATANYKAVVSAKEKDPLLANNSRSVQMTVACPVPAGNLFITSSEVALQPHQLLGGTLGDSVLSLDLSADVEAVNVTTLRFTLPVETVRSLDRVELTLAGETVPFAVATIAGCGSDNVPNGTVCAQMTSRELVVMKGLTKTILARPRLRTDVDGAVSGDLFSLTVLSAEARGDSSVTALKKNDDDQLLEGEIFIGRSNAGPSIPVTGPTSVVVLSNILSITNANPDADGTAVPTGTTRSLGQFKFTATSHNNTKNGLNRFTLDRAIFTVDLENVGVDPTSFKLYNKTDISMRSSCTVDPASTATKLFVDCPSLASSDVDTRIDPGSTATFVLESTITNPQVVSSIASSIQVSLEQYNDPQMTTVSASKSHVGWNDADAVSSTPFFWIESVSSFVRSTKYESPVMPTRMLGDVNNDGKIASADTILMRRHVDGIITLTGADFTAGDVDLDGKITFADFYLVRGAIGQMITLPALYGDMNGDGKLTSDDTTLLADFVSGAKTPTNRQKYLGDVNVDVSINPNLDLADLDWHAKGVSKLVFLPVLCGNTLLNTDVHEQCDDGNQTDGDGCDNMCRIIEVAQNELTITQKATASMDTAVKNQKDVSLLRFEARADNEGVLLTELRFDASAGSLVNAQNYSLIVDTDSDGVVDTPLQSGVNPISGVISFDQFTGAGFGIQAMQTVVFEVHADIASSFIGNTLQLKFATSVPSYVSAERMSTSNLLSGIKTDGVCPTVCETTVTTVASTLWSLKSQGDLFITQSSTPVRSRQLLGSALSDDILRLSFRADAEDIDVTNLVFTATSADASFFAQNVSRLELYQVGSVTPFAVATVGACGADPVPANSMCAFMSNSQFVIPKGTNASVLVRARMKSDSDGAVSGKKLTLSLDAVAGAKARGVLSSNNLSPSNGDSIASGEYFIGVSAPGASQTIIGKDHVSVMSKVVTITNADPNANGSMIPSGSNRAISQLKFTAASHSNVSNGMNRVVIDTLIYTVNATNVSLDPSAFKVYNKADSSINASCSLDPASTATLQYVVCPNLSTSSVNTEIDAGSDATLVLEANVLNAQVNPSLSSALQVSLQNFSNSTLGSLSVAGSHIRWIDRDNSSTTTTFLWMESPETVINGTAYQN